MEAQNTKKSRTKLWVGLVGAFVILFITLALSPSSLSYKSTGCESTSRGHSYGIITVTTNGSKTIYTGGNSIISVPLARVSWKEYHDGKLTRTLTPEPEKQPVVMKSIELPFKEVSWKLTSNQNVESVRFAYFIYKGSTPPKDWYDVVLRNCTQ